MEPVYKQVILLPPICTDKVNVTELTWHLRGQFPYTGFSNPKYFVCMQAYQACGDERRCRTPTFIGDHIPDAIEEWMRTFADILTIGMAIGRPK